MALTYAHMLSLVVHLAVVFAYPYDLDGAINHDAQPYAITMVNNKSVGPDGPWWYIEQDIAFPPQMVQMLPSIAQTSLTVNQSACRNQQASCPLPLPTMWTITDAYRINNSTALKSELFDAATWDQDYAALLDMSGSGSLHKERMTLHRDGDYNDLVFLDRHALAISTNYTVQYSADAEYTMNTGFMSLNGARETTDWEAVNGTSTGGNRTLYHAYEVGAIPSMSYGLHVGSVEPNVTGSLILGGYDSSRCLTDPIISSVDTVQLEGIAMNVSSGGYAYSNTSSAYIPDLLRAGGGVVNSLSVHPRPGVPHLYLPRDTCDAIASHLPVNYDHDFDLYFWDTQEQAYKDIVSSPHHLDFTFSSDDGKQSTISVPFALLNLTLTSPLVSTTTQYLPCKPWTPDVSGYTLGNAFLQSAFFAQNWQENKLFLAQAPGPDFLSSSIQKIAYTDTTLTPAKNPPSWQDSWSTTLKALPANSSGSPSSKLNTSDSSTVSVSGGAIAGIVAGALAALAILGAVVWLLVRRRRRRQRASAWASSQDPNISSPQYYQHQTGVPYYGKPALTPHEVEAEQAQVSELWTGQDVVELPAEKPGKPQTRG